MNEGMLRLRFLLLSEAIGSIFGLFTSRLPKAARIISFDLSSNPSESRRIATGRRDESNAQRPYWQIRAHQLPKSRSMSDLPQRVRSAPVSSDHGADADGLSPPP